MAKAPSRKPLYVRKRSKVAGSSLRRAAAVPTHAVTSPNRDQDGTECNPLELLYAEIECLRQEVGDLTAYLKPDGTAHLRHK